MSEERCIANGKRRAGCSQQRNAQSRANDSRILKGSEYSLTLFTADEVTALELFERNGKAYLTCASTLKPRPAKPEEIVRQLYLRKLINEYGYSRDRIALEKQVYFGSAVHEKAADIVIWERGTTDRPYIIVECKKPKRKGFWCKLRGRAIR
jgi:type I restriction enzyme M protein